MSTPIYTELQKFIRGTGRIAVVKAPPGSGKSYTMTGSEENKGLVPRICESIFERISSSEDSVCTFKVECFYMEIYNEKCRDLLNLSKQNLRVREHQFDQKKTAKGKTNRNGYISLCPFIRPFFHYTYRNKLLYSFGIIFSNNFISPT
jgi:hypothetical protein